MSRAAGLAAMWLLAVSAALGWASAAAALRRPGWVRPLQEIHRILAVVGWLGALVHVLLLRYDPSVPFSWRAILVPGASPYRPFWVALGVLVLYGWAVTLMAFDARGRWGSRIFRASHGLSPLVMALVAFHAAGAGTDAGLLSLKAAAAGLGGLAVGMVAERAASRALWRRQTYAGPRRGG